MSGGKFDYDQYRIITIADTLQSIIDNNDSEEKDEWGDAIGGGYCPEVIEKFKIGVEKLREAYIYAQRADWLLSGDDGEDNFLRRLEEELEEIYPPIDEDEVVDQISAVLGGWEYR